MKYTDKPSWFLKLIAIIAIFRTKQFIVAVDKGETITTYISSGESNLRNFKICLNDILKRNIMQADALKEAKKIINNQN